MRVGTNEIEEREGGEGEREREGEEREEERVERESTVYKRTKQTNTHKALPVDSGGFAFVSIPFGFGLFTFRIVPFIPVYAFLFFPTQFHLSLYFQFHSSQI